MKRMAYTVGLLFSVVGFAIATAILIGATQGYEISGVLAWVRPLHIGALAAWGGLFLLPGVYAVRELDPTALPAETPPFTDLAARRVGRVAVLLLVIVTVLNCAWVMRERSGVTAVTPEERAAQYPISRRCAVRMYAGIWVGLYGVPLVGFTVLRREAS